MNYKDAKHDLASIRQIICTPTTSFGITEEVMVIKAQALISIAESLGCIAERLGDMESSSAFIAWAIRYFDHRNETEALSHECDQKKP